MPDPRKISIQDFTYDLPEEKIALHPLQERDASKLLIYKNGKISTDTYRNIAGYLTPGSLLVFNNTKVINARLRFKKNTGTVIEVFCLEPYELINDYSTIMNRESTVKWKCLVGGAAKWKEKELTIDKGHLKLKAELVEKLTDAYVISFSWEPAALSFAEVIHEMGDIPLPPYIKRSTESEDTDRYQTIYAKHDGSVAAPTAGLHFTENIFEQLAEKNIDRANITLHVGAGTFKPVKADRMEGHEMHAEWIDVSRNAIEQILSKDEIIAVGTTSARTIETLYWLGLKCLLNPAIHNPELGQWDVYEKQLANADVPAEKALHALLNWMTEKKTDRIFTQTQLLIVPGYSFKIIKGLITNFHQPQSTLLLLVAAATAGNWKHIYEYALHNDFRFLSYGDGNLVFI